MAETGLTSEEAARLAQEGKANVVPSKSNTSVRSIIIRNTFTYFNAIFALLAVAVIVAGSYKSLTFLPVIIANTVIGIVQQLRAKKVLDELALLDVSEYTAIRDGADARVASDALVLGDLVRLESGQQVPADAVVVSGEAGVNESLLTGEADEVQKAPGDELMSGSFVVAGAFVARLVRAIPAALTTFIAIADMMLFAELFDISAADVGTASTYLLSVVGFLILINLIQPPNRYRIGVLLLCVVGLIVCCGVLWQLFDISALSPRALVLCVVFGLAEVGVLLMLSTAIKWAYKQIRTRKGQKGL